MIKKSIRAFWVTNFTILALNVSNHFSSVQYVAASTTVNAQSENLLASNQTNNQLLQKIIDTHNTGTTTIYIPKGVYIFGPGHIKLHSNIKFNFAPGASFKINSGALYFVYPSPKAGYNGGLKNITWNNATFIGNDAHDQSSFTQSLNHAQNVQFQNATFYNCEKPDGHYLDLDGSRDILINNSTFWGFNSKLNNEFKEAIQIDYSNAAAMSYSMEKDVYDNLPSYNICIQNSRFLPIIINDKIRYYAPNPIGEHVTYNNAKAGLIHDIVFTNNQVIDARPQNKIDTGTINFRGVNQLTIKYNWFSNIHTTSTSANYIRIHNPLFSYRMQDINISANHFTNIVPRYQMILFNTRYRNATIRKIIIQNNTITTFKTPSRFISQTNNPITATDNQFIVPFTN